MKRFVPKRRGHIHCLIWKLDPDRGVLIRCAHCTFVKSRLAIEGTYDADLIQRQVTASQAGHRRLCKKGNS